MRDGTSDWILGLNHGSHDAACALIHRGRLVAYIEQERLSRRKRAPGDSPAQAVNACLEIAGITIGDISAIALGSDHDALARWLGLSQSEKEELLPYSNPAFLLGELYDPRTVPPIVSIPHHLAHAASCYWPSGFGSAAILVLDAMGDSSAGLTALGTPDGIEAIGSVPIDVSLGFFYEAAGIYTGLGKNSAGKVMGLAAYGRVPYSTPLQRKDSKIGWEGIPPIAGAIGRDLILRRTEALLQHYEKTAYPFSIGDGSEPLVYADFAAGVQRDLEECILDLLSDLRRTTGVDSLAMAGGVALNCACNGRICDAGIFSHVYIQPASHDGGVAIGAAMFLAHESGMHPMPMESVYVGREEPDYVIEEAIRESGLHYERLGFELLPLKSASVLAEGAIVAWHQGRSEAGPRALGGRSLLGDPRSRSNVARINSVKGREIWRPFAPVVIDRVFDEFFEGTPNPYMLVASRVRLDRQRDIPAIVHVDGTARPQVVSESQHPLVYALLTEFERKTGIGILINTSLNTESEPIADSIRDTLDIFRRCDIDFAAAGPFLVSR